MEKQPILTILVGAPGTGKSHWIKSSPDFADAFVFSSDDIIEQWAAEAGTTYDALFKDKVNAAIKEAGRLQGEAIKEGRDVVRDQTNMGSRKRAAIIDEFLKAGYEARAVVFRMPESEAEKAEHAERLASRPGKTIGPEVVRSLCSKYEEPALAEGFSVITFVNTFRSDAEPVVIRGDGPGMRQDRLDREAAAFQDAVDDILNALTPDLLADAWLDTFGIARHQGEPLPANEIPAWLAGAAAFCQKRLGSELDASGLEWSDVAKEAVKIFRCYFRTAS